MSGGWAAAGQAAAGIAGGFISNAGNKNRQENAFKQEKKMMGIQFLNQQKLNQQGYDLQKRMWEETNAPAQMAMLKEAGLNPALMYGGSGAGGSTTTGSQGGGSAAKGNAPNPIPMDIGAAIQSAMAASTIELQKAQAGKLEAEEEKLKGADTDKVTAETQSITQGIENQKAQEALLRAQKIGQDIANNIQGKSANDQIDYLQWAKNKIENEAKIAGNEEYISTNTLNDKITQIKAEAFGALLENELKESNRDLNTAKIQEISESIKQRWQDLMVKQMGVGQQEKRIMIEKFKSEIQAEYPSVMNTIGKIGNMAFKWLDDNSLDWGNEGKQETRKPY